MSSVAATMKQGGHEGSALKALERTSAIGKNRKAPSQHISGGIDQADPPAAGQTVLKEKRDSAGQAESAPPSPTNVQSDSDDEYEFDVVNPLFQHAGSDSRRFQTDTASFQADPIASAPIRMFKALKEKGRTADGRLSVSVLHVTGLKNASEARIRFSLNGQVDWSDTSKKMFDLAHYNSLGGSSGGGYAAGIISNSDPCELNIEINDAETDSFWGAASLQNIDKVVGPIPKKMNIPILDVNQVAIGELEVTLTYHKYTFSDMAGIRWKWFLEWPHTILVGMKNRSRAWGDATKNVILTGLPGMQGGAASWVVMGVLCVPFILFTLFTNVSWATRQWLLVIPLYLYLSASLPVILGWIFSTLVTAFAMHGYPGGLSCSALHITPWIKGYALQLRVTALDLRMGNPPGFPLSDFFHCKRADVAGSISLKHLLDIIVMRYKKCPLRKVADFRLLALWDIDYIEVDEFTLDFMMYHGKMNICEITHLLADHEARQLAWAKGYLKATDPMPNELEIRIIRAKNLVKTRTSKTSMKAQLAMSRAASGPLGRNAVFDAFLEEDTDDDDEEEDNEDGGTLGDQQKERRDTADRSVRRRESEMTSDSTGETFPEPNEELAAQRRKYRGLGPPQFNPMDATVKPQSKQGHFDPYVVVSLRRDVQKTKTQTKTNSPMWNETFFFHVTDAATVVHVQVYNREVTQDRLIGQWIMTIKHMLSNPFYCWHEKGLEVTKERWIRGWFPLINKRFRGVGRCGKLEMAMQWRYVPEAKLRRKMELPPLSALAQLQENSEESRLRMGDMARIKYWLHHEPFLFDVKRMSVFNFRLYLQDIFLPGQKGEAEKKGVDSLHFINIPRVDWLEEFRSKHGDLGITTYTLLYKFFAGIAPKVMNTAQSQANVSRTLGVIAGAAVPQLKHGIGQSVKSLLHGGVVGKGLFNVGKSADRAIQLVHRNVTVNKDADAQFKVPVTAEDEDFLLETPVISGHLARYATKLSDLAFDSDPALQGEIKDVDMEKESRRRGTFRKKYFELKGRTLFYRKNQVVSKNSIYGVTYKIPLSQVIGAIYFVEQEEIMLNMQGEGIVTRLKLVANDTEGGEDEEAASEVSLEKWFQALKDCGVNCYTWRRAESSRTG